MSGIELPEAVGQWANDILVWIGFGTLVGLLAKAIMPGRDPGGAIATVLTGMAGSVIGAGTLMFIGGARVTPLSLIGFLVATAGALILLLFYRLLVGRIFREDGTGAGPGVHRLAGRRRRRVSVLSE